MDDDMLRLHYAVILTLFALPAFADETHRPDGTNSSDSGTTCDASVHASLDEDPDTPTGNCGVGGSGVDCCRADSNNTSWSFIVTMPDPTETLTDGANLQEIRIYTESFDEGQSADPTIQIVVRDTTTVACDTVHFTGTDTTLTDAGYPAILAETWDSTGLSSANDVCVEIICTKSGGAPGARNSCDIDAIEWNATSSAAGGRTRRVF
jgi:hypothetical protein